MNVTEVMVRSVVLQFQATPTSSKRSLPVPVVCEKLTLPAVVSPVPLVGVPSRVTGAKSAAKLAVTSTSAVTAVSVRGLAVDPSLQSTKWQR